MRRKWSDEFLVEAPWEIKRQRDDAQYDYDIAGCERHIRRAQSEKMHGYRACPEKACKRARRCIAPSLVCVTICQLPLTEEQEWIAIERLYEVAMAIRAAQERAEKRRG
ncbi:hypothetical protein ACSVBT_04120 [Afipia sp. TerB]